MPTQEVLHGVDPREPFVRMGMDESPLDEPTHSHVCPDCQKTYVCQEPAPYLSHGDSDEDCRWYEVVVCPTCLSKRMPLAAG